MSTLLEQDRINRERLSTSDFNKNFLVSAGAGAGKTYLTVQRAFNMLCDRELGIHPQDIVLITFTRKAATEMKTRLNQWIRGALAKAETDESRLFLQGLLDSLPEMQISTIHSFCQRVLNDYPLESGVGFAPEFDSEEGGPDSRSEIFFNEAWNTGMCPDSVNAGIRQEMMLGAFTMLNNKSNVQPQFVDTSTEAGRAFANDTLDMCKRLIALFSGAVESVDPSLFHYTLENAIRSGDDPTTDVILAAARTIARKGKDARNWMGKNSSKTAVKAVADLSAFLSGGDADAALEAIEQMFASANGAKKINRHDYMLERVHMLPAEYRICAEAVEGLPDNDALDKLSQDIDLLLHGVVMREALQLRQAYADYRKQNHIVTLDDMLTLTARLVREHPSVREKLHRQYKVFFVDEFQDTDPIQTDIIFGIAADQYDPDWHRCVAHPGSLFLVGDAKQGIYRFRGADISMWQEVEHFMEETGGEVVPLYMNYRSTSEICDAVTSVFGDLGPLRMQGDAYQAEYREMVAHRGHGPEAVFHHELTCESEGEGHRLAAQQIAQYIQDRVQSGQNRYEDFLLLSFYREKHMAYADEFRKRKIPVKFDGKLPMDDYQPIYRLNLRVQAVCHPLDETLSFRVLCECGNVLPEEWDLFRMCVKELPEETLLTRYRDTRSLMAHVDELTKLLPDTEMNRRILKALAMLNRDRLLSQQRTPCAFLEELVEKSDGLFVDPYDAEEFQNQYAALLWVIDSIRSKNPQQFVDMADILSVYAESEMDRMPSIRADSNFVRLMNLHKAKGLQGKIVIYLPGKPSTMGPDSNVQRDENISRGWFVLKEKGNERSVQYAPPEWEDHKKEEAEILKAEKVRLKYVALTRAEDEAHVFTLRIESGEGKAKTHKIWSGFEATGTEAAPINVEDVEEQVAPSDELERPARAEQRSLECRLPMITQAAVKRVTPSEVDATRLKQEPVKVEEQIGQGQIATVQTRPGGTSWGTAVHRAAELIVSGGCFTEDALEAAAMQAVTETFESELLSERERAALLLPKDMRALEQIRKYLAGEIIDSLRFMLDEHSSFRQMLKDAVCYPEMPFVVSIGTDKKALFEKLVPLTKVSSERRIDISGKIDLALRYLDGTWRIVDYKTDRMLPCDRGDAQAFRRRLDQEYGNQLSTYQAVLEYLTGEKVIEAKLLAI